MNPEAAHKNQPQQEPGDISARAVLWVVAGILAMVVVVALVAGGLTRTLGPNTRGPVPETPARSSRPSRSIRLSSDPVNEIAAFERDKRSRLDSYGWVDRQHQFAHVPIEQAMRTLAAQERDSSKRDAR